MLLFGVKTTLNRLAVKLELSWQVLRDFDSISRMADALENKESIVVNKTKGVSIVDLMVRDLKRNAAKAKGFVDNHGIRSRLANPGSDEILLELVAVPP